MIRTRSPISASSAATAAASSSSVTQRVPAPPPWKPSRASTAHTVPDPASKRLHDAAASATSTVTDGARTTPARSSRASTFVLSSRATHSGRRWATSLRPTRVGDSVRNVPNTTAVWSGSKPSTASTMDAGGSAILPIASRNRTIGVASSGMSTAAIVASGWGPAPSPSVATTRMSDAPRSRSGAMKGVQIAAGPPATITRRPRTNSPSGSRHQPRSDDGLLRSPQQSVVRTGSHGERMIIRSSVISRTE